MMKKLLSIFAAMLIATAAVAQTAEQNYQKGVEAYKARKNAEAVSFFQKAANQGHAKAQTLLGACYYDGEGVAQNKQKAVEWYQRAAEQGNEAAIEFMKKNW